jgi:transcriptional regulator with XRE-family HTH domain
MNNVRQDNGMSSDSKRHFIPEWTERRHLKQADIVRELDVDKGVVSRWFSGVIPSDKYLEPLAGLLETSVTGLFRHPDDDWIAKMFRDRTEEQKEGAIKMLKAFFETMDAQNTQPGSKANKG